jgi:hypothetical protein
MQKFSFIFNGTELKTEKMIMKKISGGISAFDKVYHRSK